MVRLMGAPQPKFGICLAAFAAVVALTAASGFGQAFNDFDLEPHYYSTAEADDAMSRLIEEVRAGRHDFGDQTGLPLLKQLLDDLNVPESSQVLVFSQTSLQKEYISPKNPRALYFNEDTHVAWMPDGMVEIISFDPLTGGRFFIEEEQGKGPINFTNRGNCFGCHAGAATNYLPGPLARSNLTSEEGRRLEAVRGHNRIGHAVPFEDRWGGYFVTGAPNVLKHLGNSFAVRESGEVKVKHEDGGAGDAGGIGAIRSLSHFFDGRKYPRDDSNILPLLLFDHQIEGHNLMMEALYRGRHADYEAAKNGGVTPKRTQEGTDKAFDRLVRYLLFADEAPLPPGAEFLVSEDYRRDFLRNRKMDNNKLSLKDLNLKTRIFEHRLSYLVYSRSFEEAPDSFKSGVYSRLWAILSPGKPPFGYEYFDSSEREKIIGILRSTKTDLPAEWGTDRQLASLAAQSP